MSYADQQQHPSRNLAGFLLVFLLHALAAYALVNGLARKIIEVVRPPMETKIIEEVKQVAPPDRPPPPPPPRLTPPPVPFIPPPEVQVQVPPPVQQQTITAVTPVKPPEVVPVAQRIRTAAVVDANTCRKPAYPPASLRANETGTVRLGFLIEADGKVVQSKVERSSGHRRLDEAARAALALCDFKPATVDGKAERAWARIEYQWKID